MKKHINAIQVKIEKLQDLYCGKPTGRLVFHCSVKGGCHPMGAVLGRSNTSVLGAMEDFVFRAKADGHKVDFKQLEIVEQVDRS